MVKTVMLKHRDKNPLNDKQKASMAEPELFPELTFAKSAELKLAGIEKYNNEDSYVVKRP